MPSPPTMQAHIQRRIRAALIARAVFDPEKHPRNPKGAAGGGRFKSIIDRLKDALQDWHEGEGDPFEGFSREQLLRAAKTQGITLRRGVSRNGLIQALIDDLHKPEGPDREKSLDGVDLTGLTDGELVDLYGHHHDEHSIGLIDAEFARRDGLGPHADLAHVTDDNPTQRRLDELLAKGVDFRTAYIEAHDLSEADLNQQDLASILDLQRHPGETREQALRRLYAESVNLTYLQAEEWTRGNVLSAEGRAKGIDPVSLFSGPRTRARKYASEELKRFWDEVAARQNYTEFKAAMRGRASDKKAAAAMKHQGQGKDFGL